MTPYFVAIGGSTATGKTYVLQQLMRHFQSGEITLVSMDNYYKDAADQVPDPATGLVNYDEPETLMLDLFAQHMQQLKHGQDVSIREYTFLVDRPAATITYRPAPIVVVEGIFVFWLQALQPLLDLKVYLDAEEVVKLARRIPRDMTERKLSLDYILKQYLTQVVPSNKKYVEPFRFDADIIIPNHKLVDKSVAVLANHLKAVLRG